MGQMDGGVTVTTSSAFSTSVFVTIYMMGVMGRHRRSNWAVPSRPWKQ